jgi:hypothetical protein
MAVTVNEADATKKRRRPAVTGSRLAPLARGARR